VDCGYSYDNFGRLSGQTWTLHTGNSAVDGTYSVAVSYDGVGRPSIITYPAVGSQSAVQIQRKYFPNGALSSLQRVSTGQTIWTVTSRTPRNQVGDEIAGNGVETLHSYDPATGLVQEIKSTLNSAVVRDALYSYDAGHRLHHRTIDGNNELFGYDVFSRLTTWEQGNTTNNPGVAYSYDDLGNLTARSNTTFANHIPSGVITGQVTFTPGDGTTVGPHQIATSSLGGYGYDQRGDQKTAPGRTTTYTNFSLPHTISANGVTTSFAYDGARARVLKTSSSGTAIVTLGGLYERRVTGTLATDVFYAVEANRAVAQISINESSTGGTEQPTLYLHDDHIGSVQMVTNPSGKIVALQSFDPFGARVGTAPAGVRVGFEALEEDDDLGLVNMQGRVYDPAQARFVTADPLTRGFLTQGLNPYSLVRNNPLNARDPSGLDGDPNEGEAPAGGGYVPTISTGPNGGDDYDNLPPGVQAGQTAWETAMDVGADTQAAIGRAAGEAAAASSNAASAATAAANGIAEGQAAADSSAATSAAATGSAARHRGPGLQPAVPVHQVRRLAPPLPTSEGVPRRPHPAHRMRVPLPRTPQSPGTTPVPAVAVRPRRAQEEGGPKRKVESISKARRLELSPPGREKSTALSEPAGYSMTYHMEPKRLPGNLG
jgi:RHS repeat-associated protein